METSEESQSSKEGDKRSKQMKKKRMRRASLMCEVCGDGPFTKPYNVRRHTLVHQHIGLGWQCPVCQHPFKQGRQRDMINHIRRVHGPHPWVNNATLIPEAKAVTYSHQQKSHSGETTSKQSNPSPANGMSVISKQSGLEISLNQQPLQHSTVPTKFKNVSITEYNLFKQWKTMVSSIQTSSFNLNCMQQNPREENTSRVVIDSWKTPFLLAPGDRVRAPCITGPLNRNHNVNSTKEIYTVTHQRLSQGFQKYKIKSMDNQLIEREFYEEELQKTDGGCEVYEVEAILDRRTVADGTTERQEVLVSWIGWSKQYNSWVPENELVDID